MGRSNVQHSAVFEEVPAAVLAVGVGLKAVVRLLL